MSFTYGIASNASQDRLEKLIEKRLNSGSEKPCERADMESLWRALGGHVHRPIRLLAPRSRLRHHPFSANHLRIEPPAHTDHRGALRHPAQGRRGLAAGHFSQSRRSHQMRRCHATLYERIQPPTQQKQMVLLCVGLGYGDVLRIGDSDVFGAEINAASKLGEDTAKAHEILVTGSVKKAANGTNTSLASKRSTPFHRGQTRPTDYATTKNRPVLADDSEAQYGHADCTESAASPGVDSSTSAKQKTAHPR